MMHKISMHLNDYNTYFTSYNCDGYLKLLYKANLLNFTVAGKVFRGRVFEYCVHNNLKIDFQGDSNNYDAVITCSDLVIQKNIRKRKIILIQEGMTDPENFMFYAVKYLGLPRYLASTSTTGLSHAYKVFCVASEGYRDLFIKKGINPDKIAVTGIPNFDNLNEFLNNSFPLKNYVLSATSDCRETCKFENRKKFIFRSLEIADGRQLIFKLHPNENFRRAIKEIRKYAPDSLIYTGGNTNHMIANCDVLITKYSSVVYTGIALGKEVYSDFDIDELRARAPIQNGGLSALNIADVCRKIVEGETTKVNNYENEGLALPAYSSAAAGAI